MSARMLAEAVAARVAATEAGNSGMFVAALAREQRLRARIAEGTSYGVHFDPSLHPRDRIGEFVNVLARLKKGRDVVLPGGITVYRKSAHYKVVGRGGSTLGRTRSAAAAAAAAMAAYELPGATRMLVRPPMRRMDDGGF